MEAAKLILAVVTATLGLIVWGHIIRDTLTRRRRFLNALGRSGGKVRTAFDAAFIASVVLLVTS